MKTSDIRAHLDRLHLEMVEAESAGLTACAHYMRDLEEEIDGCRAALVGARVTDIAIARAELYGILTG